MGRWGLPPSLKWGKSHALLALGRKNLAKELLSLCHFSFLSVFIQQFKDHFLFAEASFTVWILRPITSLGDVSQVVWTSIPCKLVWELVGKQSGWYSTRLPPKTALCISPRGLTAMSERNRRSDGARPAPGQPPIFQRHGVEAEKSYLQPAPGVKGGSEKLVSGRADGRNSGRSPSRLTTAGIPHSTSTIPSLLTPTHSPPRPPAQWRHREAVPRPLGPAAGRSDAPPPKVKAGSGCEASWGVPEPRKPESRRTCRKAVGDSGHARSCWAAQALCWSRSPEVIRFSWLEWVERRGLSWLAGRRRRWGGTPTLANDGVCFWDGEELSGRIALCIRAGCAPRSKGIIWRKMKPNHPYKFYELILSLEHLQYTPRVWDQFSLRGWQRTCVLDTALPTTLWGIITRPLIYPLENEYRLICLPVTQLKRGGVAISTRFVWFQNSELSTRRLEIMNEWKSDSKDIL